MKIGVVGATGEVGRMMLQVLEEMEIPVTEIRPFASAKSAGKRICFKGKKYIVEELTDKVMREKYDYLLFSAGSSISVRFAPIAVANGNIVIDNSSAFRRDNNIPLVVPEINGDVLKDYQGIVANPNCSTIQMVLPLAALDKEYDLEKVVVSTYQSVSGSGRKGISELEEQEKGKNESKLYSKQIHRNVLPEIGTFRDDLYTDEEEKMRFETNKILGKYGVKVSATTVRVPVVCGHSESIYCEFKNKVDLHKASEVIENMESVKVNSESFDTPLDIEGTNESYVSRLRYGVDDKSLAFWCVADNIRLGAALNAVRILKKMCELNRTEEEGRDESK